MFGSIRKWMAVGVGVMGVMFASVAQAGPVVAVTVPTVQLVAHAPPMLVVQSPRRVWVPGFVRYDAHGHPVHVAGYWTTQMVSRRRVVTTAPRVHTVTTTHRSRKVVVRR